MARRGRLPDFVLIAALAALVVAAAVDAVRPHRHHRPTQELAARPPARAHASPRRADAAPATVPLVVALRGSPETAFLPDCRRGRIVLSIKAGGPWLLLRRSGGRCHLPALRFEATVRARSGAVLYHG